MQWLLQLVLLGCAACLAVWAQLPSVAVAGLGLAAGALLVSPVTRTEFGNGLVIGAFWGGSISIWVKAAFGDLSLNSFYAVPAFLVAAAVWPTARRASSSIWKVRWNAALMAWVLCGAFAWLAAGYFQNQGAVFFTGLIATLASLVVCRIWFSWGPIGGQLINTIILLLMGLPAVDLGMRTLSRVAIGPETCRRFYSLDTSRGDPEAFARWEEYYTSQFDKLGTEVFMPDPAKVLPFRLRPGSRGTFVGCPISINSLGFRGPEFQTSKDDAYRIVVLGESTTFGMTIQPDDKPWPELLEQIIRERLKSSRRVEVINAGVPAYTLPGNISRLPREILPLKPDMIISYHGANGFRFIDSSMLPASGPAPPVYEDRPLKIAASIEHRLRMAAFQHQATRSRPRQNEPSVKPLESKYADAYRQLIECARTNKIRLALANFSMAVNQSSDPKVIDFYRGGGARNAIGFVRANAVHSQIVRELAARNPEVCFVDTHPHLDGEHENFIDVIHFSPEGERQLAENVFAGISNVLQADLVLTTNAHADHSSP